MHFARLGPDQPALAAAEMAALEARARVGRGQRRMRDEHTVRTIHFALTLTWVSFTDASSDGNWWRCMCDGHMAVLKEPVVRHPMSQ